MPTELLTNTMITTLRTEASAAGDAAMVSICAAALDGHIGPRYECAEAISEARAMDTSRRFVPVVAEQATPEDEQWDAEMMEERAESAGWQLPE